MTRKEFKELVQSRIIVADGATGSNLQKSGMPAGVSPENWILENPRAMIELQRDFLSAGSDILLAPTFTANRIKLEEYRLAERMEEINRGLVELSKKAILEYRELTGSSRKIYIAADLTMTGELVYPLGNMPFEELIDVYKEQLKIILKAGVDLVVVETMMSLQECRAALLAVKETCDLPVIISMTYNENGRTLYGTDPKTAVVVLQSMGADAIGINCSTGPDKMHEVVREMKKYANVPILVKPNAGIPKLVDGETCFPMNPEEFADEMTLIMEDGANIVGGCCGTTPAHIRLLSQKASGHKPFPIPAEHIRALSTDRKTYDITLDGAFIIVGERINPTGKKELQAQLREGNYELVSEMATEQAELGASILDINVGMNGIDEREVMLGAVQEALHCAKLPLSIDSSHISVIEAALRIYPGRALINSISLEKEKFEKLIPIAAKYGAMFILLPLSDQGLPKDLDEKKQIIHTVLNRASELGLTKEDVIVDGLVTTIGANQKAAAEALETIRYCKEELGIATIVGLSNISFGLPQRQFINSTFLAFAIQAGLTMAISNPSQDLLVSTSLAADLLRGLEEAPQRYIDHAALPSAAASLEKSALKREAIAEQKLQGSQENMQKDQKQESGTCPNQCRQDIFQAVVKGNKKSIVTLVEKELKEISPEQLIDQTLIPAINEVGRLYDRQIYFLPQLIAGAQTMKLAIDYLEPMLQKNENSVSKGTIVIATVAGDIHDIGKNLVALMLKNYGFHVIDLGKDVSTEKIIHTAREEDADIIALSALMTTTMVEMKKVVQRVKEEGLRTRIIIGGAVITEGYAKEIGADGYSEDAGSAVALVNTLLGN